MTTPDERDDLNLIREAAARTRCLNPDNAADIAAWITGADRRMKELSAKEESGRELAELARRFLTYLDIVEESDEGKEFHPVRLSCCRAMWTEDLESTLVEMRRAVGLPEVKE